MRIKSKVVYWTSVLAVAVLAITSASATPRGVSFQVIEPPNDPAYPFGVPLVVTDMSADGSIIVGIYGGLEKFRWTEATGVVKIGGSWTAPYISDDGSTIVGAIWDGSGIETAAIWNSGTSWTPLGTFPGGAEDCFGTRSNSYGVNSDGSIIVGLAFDADCRAVGFMWDQATGMNRLDGINDDNQFSKDYRANVVNSDGSVIAGWSNVAFGRAATDWINEVPRWLDPAQATNPDVIIGEVLRVTPDGSTYVGTDYRENPPFSPPDAYIWTEQDGVRSMGRFPWAFDFDQGVAADVTDDGGMAVGRFGFFFFTVGMFWTEETGMVDIAEFLVGQGVDVPAPGFFSMAATTVSADGSRISGWGYNLFFQQTAWVLDIGKVKVCHAVGGSDPRTLAVNFDSMGDHVAHGDDLAACENGGARSTYAPPRPADAGLNSMANQVIPQWIWDAANKPADDSQAGSGENRREGPPSRSPKRNRLHRRD